MTSQPPAGRKAKPASASARSLRPERPSRVQPRLERLHSGQNRLERTRSVPSQKATEKKEQPPEPQPKESLLSRRSLMLTGGCLASGAFVAFLPRISALGVLGEDAAMTVSTSKRFDKWERDIRANINTEYLTVDNVERVQSDSNNEDTMRLIVYLSLTEAGIKDNAAAAAALASLGEYGRPNRLNITQGDETPAIDVYRSSVFQEANWLNTLQAAQAYNDAALDGLEATITDSELVIIPKISTGTWEEAVEHYSSLYSVQLPKDTVGRYRLNLKETALPSGANASIRVDIARGQNSHEAVKALEEIAKSPKFSPLTVFTLTWLGEKAEQKDRVIRLDFSKKSDERALKEDCTAYLNTWLAKLPGGLEATVYRGKDQLAITVEKK